MSHIPLLLALVFVVVPFAGCFGDNDSTPGATGKETYENFDALAVGKAPAGWTASAGSSWVVQANATAPSKGNVVHGSGTGARNWLLADGAGTFGNMDAKVQFNIQSTDQPGGAGFVFHYVDATHYYLIRYSPTEVGWHLFLANGGDPDKKGDATLTTTTLGPLLGQWTQLTVSIEGTHIEAKQGDTKVIDYTEQDASAPTVGTVGLFTRGNTVALFDNFEVDP